MAARSPRSGMDIRLRWWAVALPAAAFAALVMLLVSGTGAEAAPGEERQHLGQLLQQVGDVWLP
ncbi:hypothetical protein [Streptomyces litchfieldiae]|uniref:Uncharacterized protein n=1 Tax=Streptomyces litchfieldiae TaxID=3075543 RepID=A0ABU2MTC5_9ACTN|nr:hypothetical protein [Streptomyces sp. DSM 44938]MDT0344884.1 hypothetical protein [Streptomyces sp. DSM 44938]